MSVDPVNHTYMDICVGICIGICIGICVGTIIHMATHRPIIKGPDSRDVIGRIFVSNGTKYRFEPRVCGCVGSIFAKSIL